MDHPCEHTSPAGYTSKGGLDGSGAQEVEKTVMQSSEPESNRYEQTSRQISRQPYKVHGRNSTNSGYTASSYYGHLTSSGIRVRVSGGAILSQRALSARPIVTETKWYLPGIHSGTRNDCQLNERSGVEPTEREANAFQAGPVDEEHGLVGSSRH